MSHRAPVLGLLLTLTLILTLTALATPQASAQSADFQDDVQEDLQPAVQTYTDLHDFNTSSLTSPGNPGILAQGRDGNLYSTTPTGGTLGFGGVFRVTPAGVYSVIYNFDGTMHGKGPKGGLTLGADGNFYGTTNQGGTSNYGTLFKVTSAGVLTVLHNFAYTDGTNPYAPPVQGTDGNFYGTCSSGGTGAGSVYKMTPAGVLTPIHIMAFSSGASPQAPLLQGTDGNFYGTTQSGGAAGGDGEIFKITAAGVFTVLYSFDFTHGSQPLSALVQGNDGSFYGTTSGGGSLDGGVVFKFTPAKVLTVLYNFNAKPASVDGKYADAGLALANDGNFYGVTSGGGANALGTLYKITPAGVYSILYNFVEAAGSAPQSTLRQHTNGKFYGLANAGGVNSLGAIFSYDIGLKPFIVTLPTSGKVAKAVGVLGGGFTGTTNVNFNGTNAIFTVASNTYITTSVPNGATTGVVNATTPGGALKSLQKFRVTPAILSLSPGSGAVGSMVTISGNSLTGATRVTFGVGKVAVFTVNSYTQITATVPAGAVTGKISVNTPGGTATSPTVFTVN
jgi:uncharacterized repeat protein (TIGR03803 family)